MLAQGVYLAPSGFESAFVSLAHTEEDVEATVTAAQRVLGGKPVRWLPLAAALSLVLALFAGLVRR